MAQNKKVLVVGSFGEMLRVARIINGLVAKLSNTEAMGDPIRVSSEERELLNEITVATVAPSHFP